MMPKLVGWFVLLLMVLFAIVDEPLTRMALVCSLVFCWKRYWLWQLLCCCLLLW
jgi:hypothetical protein